MSTLAIWCRVVQSRDVSPHNFDGLLSGLAFSVAPVRRVRYSRKINIQYFSSLSLSYVNTLNHRLKVISTVGTTCLLSQTNGSQRPNITNKIKQRRAGHHGFGFADTVCPCHPRIVRWSVLIDLSQPNPTHQI